MIRRYAATDVIGLPRMSAPAALALGAALASAAKKYGVPKPAERAAQRLTAAHGALDAALVTLAPKKGYGPEAIAADRIIDDCWGALHDWLHGWARLPRGPQRALAAGVIAAIFPTGLGFIQLPYREEWAESATRLTRLDEGGHEQAVVELGGKEFVKQVKAAHKVYGEQLDITASSDAAPDAPGGTKRPQIDAFANALRAYVLKVASHADEDDAASGERVANLLKPLTEFRARSTASAETTTPAPDPATPA
jgi:hypothetical protein